MTSAPRGTLAIAVVLPIILASAPGEAATRLGCKGVMTFGDAMTRSVTWLVDLDRSAIYTPSCRKYTELTGFCSGDVLRVADHSFHFGEFSSRENTKLRAELHRNIGPVTDRTQEVLPVVLVGRCLPTGKPWPVRMR